jgi:hypothetical protein
VRTSEDHAECLEYIKSNKAAQNKITDKIDPAVDAANKAHKTLTKLRSDLLAPLIAAEKKAREADKAYLIAEEDRRQADQRKLQAEADERARKERERIAAQMAKAQAAGKAEKAEALAEKMEAVEAPVVQVASRVEAKGAALTKTWQGEVVDMALLILAAAPGSVAASFLMVDESAVRKFAIATKGAVPVPGVRWSEKVGMSVRSK